MSKKSRFRGPFNNQDFKWDQNVLKIWMTPILPYLLITLKDIKFEKDSLSDKQNIRTAF